ncbi:hypothetical protein J4734_09320 [Klebsiella pneumoniae]|uniref:Uncharacterized protein n=1 Tax=Klebsiella pneumoniae TaxID=573 RepID=A0A939NMT0_KLEPN|nr:hypothetical protein [Klebsiella pneumoniae]
MINRKHLQVWESKRDAAMRKGKPVPEYKPRQVSQATKAQHLSSFDPFSGPRRMTGAG